MREKVGDTMTLVTRSTIGPSSIMQRSVPESWLGLQLLKTFWSTLKHISPEIDADDVRVVKQQTILNSRELRFGGGRVVKHRGNGKLERPPLGIFVQVSAIREQTEHHL